jgi:imidazole glycerol-phosphate synthase subunit HisH
MKTTVFDYGAGNLHSLVRALHHVGAKVSVESDPLSCANDGSLFVLPGVGAFGQASKRLAPARDLLRRQLLDGRPALGICLGMQLFLSNSEEDEGEGLGVIPGTVRRLETPRVPNMGWSKAGTWGLMYFAHSYICVPENPGTVTQTAVHQGQHFAAAVKAARTVGVQFHPEKSSAPGLELLRLLIDEVMS